MNFLKQIFEMQAELQKLHGHDFDQMTIEEKEHYTRDSILYLLEETHELLRETNFKTYKKARKEVIIEKIYEEISDISAFLFNLALAWGLTPEKYFEEFQKKNIKNLARLNDKNY